MAAWNDPKWFERDVATAKVAAETERSAIVAWLRGLKTGAISPDHAADDIESGVHLNAEQVTR